MGKPLTGDHVSFLPAKDQQNGRIEHISPRKNQLVRPPAANIDQMIVVITAGVPAADLLLLDRLLIQTEQWEMEAMLCINKCDKMCIRDSPCGWNGRVLYGALQAQGEVMEGKALLDFYPEELELSLIHI